MRVLSVVLCLAAVASPISAGGFEGMFSFAEPATSAPPAARAPSARQPLPLDGVPRISTPAGEPGPASGIPGLSELASLGPDAEVPKAGRPVAREPAVSGPKSISPDKAICISAIREAERRHGLPENILLAIGLQEAGRKIDGELTVWPWSANVEGEGFVFDTRTEAEAFVSARLAAGSRSIDIGCMQINLRWHPDAFANPSEGFDPYRSADYAARFLKRLRAESKGWIDAAGKYHSQTPHLKTAYTEGIERNLMVAEARADSFGRLAEEAIPKIAALTGSTQKNLRSRHGLNPLRAPVRAATDKRVWRRSMGKVPGAKLAAVNRLPETEAPAVNIETGSGPWWTAELSGRDGEISSKTIYGNRSIEPVIPSARNVKFRSDKATES